MTQRSRNGSLAIAPVRTFARNEKGATAIEYALIAVGIAMAIVVVVPDVGSTVSGLFADVVAAFA
ncbi:MAG: Flp family type IVb pilin [Pseudomonadota bacterium]